MERCQDRKCKGYGKPLVERGYGYPVCPTVMPLHESDDEWRDAYHTGFLDGQVYERERNKKGDEAQEE